MLNSWQLYGILVGGILVVVVGLTLLAMLIGWWGLRKALRKSRACRECGRWGTELDIIIHECLEHERE